jgi:hypothetical protein
MIIQISLIYLKKKKIMKDRQHLQLKNNSLKNVKNQERLMVVTSVALNIL